MGCSAASGHPLTAAGAACEMPAPSPACLDFLSTLHTGCTPRDKEVSGRQGGRMQRWGSAEMESSRLSMYEDSEEEGAEGPEELLVAAGAGGGWQPKGIDSFICEVRTRRGKLQRLGCTHLRQPLAEAPAPRGGMARRAPDLLQQL